jgi:hypothetical protein
MASYDFLFDVTGLRDWCSQAGETKTTSMADFLAKAKGEAVSTSIWDFPFPSLDALNRKRIFVYQRRIAICLRPNYRTTKLDA